VAPWSDNADGQLQSYPKPSGARDTMAWHRYLSTLYWYAFNASRLRREEVKGALHTYSNVLMCRGRGHDPALEPTFAKELRLRNFKDCQCGIRVYDEFRQQMEAQAGGAGVPHYVTEWNSFVGSTTRALDDPAWPCNNYPEGLLPNVVDNMARQDNLLGFAVFVDRDPVGGNPIWRACAAKGHLAPVEMSDEQRARLEAWDRDMDHVFRAGWEVPDPALAGGVR
jgi:hypothetical protein